MYKRKDVQVLAAKQYYVKSVFTFRNYSIMRLTLQGYSCLQPGDERNAILIFHVMITRDAYVQV